MQIIRRTALEPLPWKNGGGVTHEVLRRPTAGQGFRWRLSVAHIQAGGPFSDFAGYGRILVLLQGDGVRLTFGDGTEACLRLPGDLVRFDGGLATQCELLGGGCSDLNLMVACDVRVVCAAVEPVTAIRDWPARPNRTALVFCITGNVDAHGDSSTPVRLGPWDTFVLAPAESGAILPAAAGGAPALVFCAVLDDNPS